MSLEWKDKFNEVAQQCDEHRATISHNLQIHTSIGISTLNENLNALSTTVSQFSNFAKFIEIALSECKYTLKESKLSISIASHGDTDTVCKNDNLLTKIIVKQKTPIDNQMKKRRLQSSPMLTVAELHKDLMKKVDQILAEEEKFFDQKFKVICRQVDKVKVTVKHESDQVISAVLVGPHEWILDSDMYELWKEMRWKGSIKAKLLAMALCD
ncbi:hypothetical protein Moror_12672 [Moniliophthora roreri MCA 2997]|uniref:Uncharacterized protein n=1 Tax=Moniliophthora roreri (strain MCA 2997) TaxID=1381753 RepID=V2XRJ4_MONRO|nr:hypothetical protein Moror_12672 [Moniliophthora roreri MCA 2997]